MSDNGRWGYGAPGSAEYFSHAIDDDIARAAFSRQRELALQADFHRYQKVQEDAKNGPVIQAMRRWLDGEPVPPLMQQFQTFGFQYRDHLRTMWDRRHDVFERGADDFAGVWHERHSFIENFGFAVPCAEAIALLLASDAPLLEIGAGSGAWSKLLQDRGADVIATDAMLEEFSFGQGRYFPVLPSQGKTAVRTWSERNVFCSWPSLNQTWFRQALRAMRPGRTVFVVREDACAEDSTWNYLHAAFRCVAGQELIGWQSSHDRFEAWVKLGPKQRRLKAEQRGPDAYDDNDDDDPPDEAER